MRNPIIIAIPILIIIYSCNSNPPDPYCDCQGGSNFWMADTTLMAGNVITPNGDGINDVWEIINLYHHTNVRWKVFDGSPGGQLLVDTSAAWYFWDGKHNGVAVSDGKYYYEIKGDNLEMNGYICTFTGSTTQLSNSVCLQKLSVLDPSDPVLFLP